MRELLNTRLNRTHLSYALVAIFSAIATELLVAECGDLVNRLGTIHNPYAPITLKQRDLLMKKAILGDKRAAFDLASYYARVDRSEGHEELASFFRKIGESTNLTKESK